MSIEHFRQFCIPCKTPTITFVPGRDGRKFVFCSTICPIAREIEGLEVTEDDIELFESQVRR